jgi:hypothetical protein
MRRRILWMLLTVAAGTASAAVALGGGGVSYTNVPNADVKAAGYAPASVLSPELRQNMVAQGSMALDGAQGTVGWYGYINDAPSSDDPTLPQMVSTPASPQEAQKTEPDKNTYLVLGNQKGADPSYWYGTHFLFQGHELQGISNGQKTSYITRINLDADVAHRVTLVATTDSDGHPIAAIDGSTWDPWAKRLLFTTENNTAPTYAATAQYPSTVTDVSGALGRGGYEGIQDDSAGNIWIVEDIGGAAKAGTKAKRPNSFIYRYVPKHPGDFAHGKLQVLQVWDGDHAVTFDSQEAINNSDQVDLRTYGKTFQTKWVTIHNTASDGNTPFDANAAAKGADGTPFKRPENGQFRPGSGFKQFYFDETGDTNADSPENGTAGGWTSIFKLTQSNPSASSGRLSLFYQSDSQTVAGLDNVTFLSRNLVTFVEDAGDGLHGQRKALDSGYIWDVTKDYSTGLEPVRWLAEGRDPSATVDSGGGASGKNEGDNEITGVHVSNGDPGPDGLLGAEIPNLWSSGGEWRWFYTQQHGDNFTWQVTLASQHSDGGDDQNDR